MRYRIWTSGSTASDSDSDPQLDDEENLLKATAFIGLTTLTVSDSEPSDPEVGDLWVDTS